MTLLRDKIGDFFIFFFSNHYAQQFEFMNSATSLPLVLDNDLVLHNIINPSRIYHMLKVRLQFILFLTHLSMLFWEYPENNVETEQVNSKRTFAYSTCGFSS